MESMDVAGVLQEAGDAGSRAYTRSQVYVEYFIILYTSTSIRMSIWAKDVMIMELLLQMMWEMGQMSVTDLYWGLGEETGGVGITIFLFLVFFLLLFDD